MKRNDTTSKLGTKFQITTISCHVMSCHIYINQLCTVNVMYCPFVCCDDIWWSFMSYVVMLCHVKYCHINLLSYHVLPCHLLSYNILSCYRIWYHKMSCIFFIIACHAMYYRDMSLSHHSMYDQFMYFHGIYFHTMSC